MLCVVLCMPTFGCESVEDTSKYSQDQDEQTSKESFRGQMLGFCIHHWEKAIILAFLITLIILVCVKVCKCSSPRHM